MTNNINNVNNLALNFAIVEANHLPSGIDIDILHVLVACGNKVQLTMDAEAKLLQFRGADLSAHWNLAHKLLNEQRQDLKDLIYKLVFGEAAN